MGGGAGGDEALSYHSSRVDSVGGDGDDDDLLFLGSEVEGASGNDFALAQER